MSLKDPFDNWVKAMQARLGQARFNTLAVLLLTGLATGALRLLDHSKYSGTALVYITVPYLIAVLITLLRPFAKPRTWGEAFESHLATSTVVFFATSIFLGEGFLCVLFFMPIYFLVALLGFAGLWRDPENPYGRGKNYAMTLPIFIAFFSLEGTTDSLSFNRLNTATASMTTALPTADVFAHLADPIEIGPSSDWLLGIFPMPVAIEAGALEEGEIHRIHTRYHRWFFTNTHEGEMELRIDQVTAGRVSATFVSDTSYFSSYVELLGSETTISVDESGMTRVTLSIHYERKLDPAWYFQPLQQRAMKAMAAHLISEVMIRE